MRTCTKCGKLQSTYNGEMIAGSICSCTPTPPNEGREIEGEIREIVNLLIEDYYIPEGKATDKAVKALTALCTKYARERGEKIIREDSLIRSYLWSEVKREVAKSGKDFWHEYGYKLHEVVNNKAGARDYYLKNATAQAEREGEV